MVSAKKICNSSGIYELRGGAAHLVNVFSYTPKKDGYSLNMRVYRSIDIYFPNYTPVLEGFFHHIQMPGMHIRIQPG
jgi:hypothetical protein